MAPRKTRRNKRYSKKRSTKRSHRGGGQGQSYAFTGASIMPGLGNAAVNQPISSCMAVNRFGLTSATPTGIPFQSGGRYGFDLTSQVAPATPFQGGIPPVVAIPCEPQYSNPLNPSTAPVQPNLRGGANPADTAALYVPTAGYTQSASTWAGSTGAPALLSIPYEARSTPSMSSACLKTGGSRRYPKKRNHTKRR
jgi:hypothetical protein